MTGVMPHARGVAVGAAVVGVVGHGQARPDIERALELAAVARLAAGQVKVERQALEVCLEMDLGRETAPRATERLRLLPPLAPAAEM